MGQILRFPVERCRPPRLDLPTLFAEFDMEMERLREFLSVAGPAWTECHQDRQRRPDGAA
jgi:hypothetical protein